MTHGWRGAARAQRLCWVLDEAVRGDELPGYAKWPYTAVPGTVAACHGCSRSSEAVRVKFRKD